ncbi:MAG: hemolysin III family protein [Gemmatimonadetes bacterium]|nr:MAG: hemolysin III family protein [Gemmatimonadota bacterium]
MENVSAGRPLEEPLNALSHAAGIVGALVATPLLVLAASGAGARWIVGSSVFAGTMILLYGASTAYHTARSPHWKARLRRLDHAAIYLFVAGTYTPFTLGALAGALGWTLFGVIWAAAAAGTLVKLCAGARGSRLSTALYVLMGWAAIAAIGPLVRALPTNALALLVAGGLAYTVGVAFYTARRLPYAHTIWHGFVLAGSACHACAVGLAAVGG